MWWIEDRGSKPTSSFQVFSGVSCGSRRQGQAQLERLAGVETGRGRGINLGRVLVSSCRGGVGCRGVAVSRCRDSAYGVVVSLRRGCMGDQE